MSDWEQTRDRLDLATRAHGRTFHAGQYLGADIRAALARVEELERALEEIGKEADHGIPFYAYGDNEAGCDLSTRLSWICGRVGTALATERGE